MEETISLEEIFEVIKKRLWMILVFVIGAGLAAGLISYIVLTPTYEAKTQFIVNQGTQDQTSQYSLNDVRFNVELISTYNDIIKSPVILEDVVSDLNLDSSIGNKIQLSSSDSSQVVTVTVTDPDINTAVAIANTTVATFQEKLPELMNVDNVHILSEAKAGENPSPVAPKPTLNIAIAIVLGGMLGVGLAFLLEYLDTTLTDEEDIEKHLDLPVLGAISKIEPEDIREGNAVLKQFKERNRGVNRAQKETS